MKTKINYLAIFTFYIIAIGCRYLTNKTNLLNGIENEYFKIIAGAIGPALGAFAVFFLFKIKPILTLKGNYKEIYFPFLLFWALPIILITSCAHFAKGTFPFDLVFSILIYGLFEELGWRGFLQQQLKSLPKIVNILMVAILWFVWHLNFEFSSSNLLFFGILLLGSWGMGVVAERTNSLLAVAAFHSLNNFFGELDTVKSIIIISLLVIWVFGIKLKIGQEKADSITGLIPNTLFNVSDK